MPLPPDAESPSVKLPAYCTTMVAGELRASLLAGAVRIDASEVESVGQAVLQLLVAARTHAGEAFGIVDPSPAFADRVAACGLADAIGLTIKKEPAQ